MMGRFLSEKHSKLVPYIPGEQPKTRKYIKLNTNESPFPPSKKAIEAAARAAESLQLYSDPECKFLTDKMAEYYGVSPKSVLMTNGSDEILNFAFMAFCDKDHPAVFPDITYGFYSVFADMNGIPYETIPLKEDYTINPNDYIGINKNIFIANPNAPTGIALPLSDIEKIVASNPDNIVVIDEAYVDFGGESAVGLTHKYENLLVTQTFSKSRSLAGARLGMGIACEAIISDLNMMKYSTNPYNINSMTMAAGLGVMEDEEYTKRNCESIISTRESTLEALTKLGFQYLPTKTNFVFAKHPKLNGLALYETLKERGILVRHFEKQRLSEFNRITIGTDDEMSALINALKEILEEQK